jgi:hypothetical protein
VLNTGHCVNGPPPLLDSESGSSYVLTASPLCCTHLTPREMYTTLVRLDAVSVLIFPARRYSRSATDPEHTFNMTAKKSSRRESVLVKAP